MPLEPHRIEVIDEAMAEVFRRKTGAERLAIASRLYASARRMLTSMLRHKYRDWTDDQISREVARRLSHGAV